MRNDTLFHIPSISGMHSIEGVNHYISDYGTKYDYHIEIKQHPIEESRESITDKCQIPTFMYVFVSKSDPKYDFGA